MPKFHYEGITSTGEAVASRECRPWGRRSAAIFLSLFTLGGLFFAVLGARNTWHMARQLAGARSTTGIILAPSIELERSTDSDRRTTTTHYVPQMAYSYKVGGERFVSDRIYPGDMLIRSSTEENRSHAEQLVREYAPGTPVTVWYLPDEPGTAFLKRERRVVNGLFCLVGGILSAAGAGLLLPQVVPGRAPRFLCAAAVFLLAQGLTWLLWDAFVAAPREELDAPPRLLQWLLLAYVVVCWAALVGNAPPSLRPIKNATLAGIGCGTISMSLSLFVLIPLMWLAPKLEPLSALPWIGVGMGVLGIIFWSWGLLTIGTPRPHIKSET